MSGRTADRLVARTLGSAAVAAGAVVLLIVVFLCVESAEALRAVGPLRFLTDASWRPTAAEPRFGLGAMLMGTATTTLGAVALAAPLGVLSAVFCRYYAPPLLSRLYRRAIELLAGVPSVVYGFWGLVSLVPWIQSLHPPGPSLLAGVLVLALMILPTVALLAEGALEQVPAEWLRGAHALGLSRASVVRGVALPAARRGIQVAVVLATARALGETIAVLMVCGNVVQVPASVFEPVRTLTANIALEMGYATSGHRSALFVSGLLLMAFVGLLVVGAEALGSQGARRRA